MNKTPIWMQKARVRLMSTDPFLSHLIFLLEPVETSSIPVAGTDGKYLYYNDAVMSRFTFAEQVGVYAHEILHCAYGHIWSLGTKDHEVWNEACDYIINDELISRGYTLPKGALYDPQKYHGWYSEKVYQALMARPKQPPQPPDGNGNGQPKPPGNQPGQPGTSGNQPSNQPPTSTQQPGTQPSDQPPNGAGGQQVDVQQAVKDWPKGDIQKPKGDGGIGDKLQEAKWEEATKEAVEEASKTYGRIPGGLEGLLTATAKPTVPWHVLMQDFMQRNARLKQTWSRPNAKIMAATGIYLPSKKSRIMPPVLGVIDSSGSTITYIQKFWNEFRGMIQLVRPSITYVACVDTVMHLPIDAWLPDEAPATYNLKGGGGTDFRPIFKWLKTADIEEPCCMIYLTDLDCDQYPLKPDWPDFPVLWVTPTPNSYYGKPPFGEVVVMRGV